MSANSIRPRLPEKSTAAKVTTGTDDATYITPLAATGIDGRAATFTNKTLTSPVINTTITGTALPTIFASATSQVTAQVSNPAGTSFAASAGSDPAVTLTTGTKVLIMISSRISCAGNYNFVGVAISGATTVNATDEFSASVGAITANLVSSRIYLQTVTAGSNTFTMQYRCNTSASGAYDHRQLTVVALP